MAPEILESVPYGQEVDIWSLGVLFFYLLFGEFPFKGINLLDDIHSKCKGGFRLADNVKSKTFFKSKKEEAALSDLFLRIFEVDRARRVAISALREHPALRGKVAEEESTEEEAINEISENTQAIEWELNQIRFIQKIVRQVETQNLLSTFLLLAFKFYVNKVLLHLIHKDSIRNYRKDKDSHPKLIKILAEMEADLGVKLDRLYQQLKELKEGKEAIPNFEEGFNTKPQEFTKFKMGYRNTVGRVYE